MRWPIWSSCGGRKRSRPDPVLVVLVSIFLFALSAVLAFRLSISRQLRNAMMTIAAVNVLVSGLGQVRGDAVFVALGHLLDVASAFLAVWAISTDHRNRAGRNVGS